MAYATAHDVAVRWARDLTCDEHKLVDVRLGDAERMLRRRIPKLDELVDSGVVLREDVTQVLADAVLRLVRNPDGYVSETDGNYTYTLQKELASGRLQILDHEWEILGVRASRMSVLVPTVLMGDGVTPTERG